MPKADCNTRKTNDLFGTATGHSQVTVWRSSQVDNDGDAVDTDQRVCNGRVT